MVPVVIGVMSQAFSYLVVFSCDTSWPEQPQTPDRSQRVMVTCRPCQEYKSAGGQPR